jgi:cytidylate kinase
MNCLILLVSTSALLATAIGFHGKSHLVKEVYSQMGISTLETGQLGRISSYYHEKLKKELMVEFGTHAMYDASSCLNPRLKLCILAAEFNPQKSYQAVFF